MTDTHNPQDVIRFLTAWAERHSSVRAMLLTSTRAVPGARVDALSDYDVILVVEDIHPFHADRTWLQDFGDVLVAYWDPIHLDPDYGLERAGNVIQFAAGLKIDFSLWPAELLRRMVAAPALPAELDAGYRVLCDKDGLTAGMRAPTYSAYRPIPPTNEAFQQAIEEFFSDAPYVAKCLWRDELLPAKWCLDHDMKHVYLRPMLEWWLAARGDCAPVGSLGKGLKKRLPPDLWRQLEQCYAGAGIEDNWRALFRTMDLYGRVAADVAERLGYTYPSTLDRRVTAYVQRIREMVCQT